MGRPGPSQGCEVGQVLGISRADLIVGPWGDHAMDNVVFLKPGSAVLELLPAGAREDDWKLAKKDVQCLDLRYEQVRTATVWSWRPP